MLTRRARGDAAEPMARCNGMQDAWRHDGRTGSVATVAAGPSFVCAPRGRNAHCGWNAGGGYFAKMSGLAPSFDKACETRVRFDFLVEVRAAVLGFAGARGRLTC